jgi:hypothetical protein
MVAGHQMKRHGQSCGLLQWGFRAVTPGDRRGRRHVASVVSQISGPGARFLSVTCIPVPPDWPGLRSRPLSRRSDGKSVTGPGSLLSILGGVLPLREAPRLCSSLGLGATYVRGDVRTRRPVTRDASFLDLLPAGRRPIPRALRICVERHGSNSQPLDHLLAECPDRFGSHRPNPFRGGGCCRKQHNHTPRTKNWDRRTNTERLTK